MWQRLSISLFVPLKYNIESGDETIQINQALTNLLLFPEEITRRGNEWRRDTLRLTLDRREVILRHLED